MDRRFYFVLIVVLMAAGCQQSPYVSSHLEILGAERRALEDRVLDLEFELDRAEKRLENCPDDDETGSGSASRRRRSSGTGSTSQEDEVTSPAIVIPGLDEDGPLNLEPPRVNQGRPAEGELPMPNGDSAIDSPRYRRPTRPIAVTSRAPGDPRITHIELNPTLTGGADFDGKSGDDGVVIFVEPRNAENEFVPLAGPITAVLLDYAKRNEGSAAMVARWKIDAPTAHEWIVNDENAQGIQLRLPWPDRTPENSKLRLDVRYTAADGRHLDARTDVFVTLPGQFSTRWTPRAPSSTTPREPLPKEGNAPHNIARQPDATESASMNPLPRATQTSFNTTEPEPPTSSEEPPTIVLEPAKSSDDDAADRDARTRNVADQRAESDARPTWQPHR